MCLLDFRLIFLFLGFGVQECSRSVFWVFGIEGARTHEEKGLFGFCSLVCRATLGGEGVFWEKFFFGSWGLGCTVSGGGEGSNSVSLHGQTLGKTEGNITTYIREKK